MSPREQIRSREAAFKARRMGDQMHWKTPQMKKLTTTEDKRWNVFIRKIGVLYNKSHVH